ncbi:MAG TPA: hypothetical protein PLE19_22935 [Planctomycetota bacterium]|nr:hypothetical protein [Planctomycetota bacterium]HRR82512.1 hypothetical protein [Planctomycetota bacterium]
MWSARAWVLIACLFACLEAQAGEERTFTIREPFGLAWGPDRVNYPLVLREGEKPPVVAAVQDAHGALLPAQLTPSLAPPGEGAARRVTLSFMATLKPDEVGQWTYRPDLGGQKPPASDLRVVEREGVVELTTSKFGIRVPASGAKEPPAPILAVRLGDGRWIGRGWWQTERPCLGYKAAILERGPVFAKVALSYDFPDNTAYKATIELSAGQDVAIISEEFDLSKGRRYEMPELGGVRPGDTFAYVLPTFESAKAALMWDWWCQTHGRVPSPNAYGFSFYEGLEPDSCEWHGRMYHEAAKPGDGGLKLDRDGRVISLNAWLQWGEDESLTFAAYNSKTPKDALAIIALRPSQWLHPDIEPHPIKTLKQYVQTNNLWIERRAKPDLFLRAPTCLGRRVYGIGVVPRDVGGASVPREKGDAGQGRPAHSEAMLRHVRLGRLELDRVKDWVLDYDEPSRYPRLFVDAGDLERMRLRTQKHLANQQHIRWVSYLSKDDPKVGDQLIAETLAGLENFVRTFATTDYGHMMYAINGGVLAHAADVALAVPHLAPDQRAKMLRYLAAMTYNGLSPDYVPPREAGFAWGSANMQSQLRARGALHAALLPNHPEGAKWRRYLTDWMTAYVGSQVNPHGATLECPHYSGMVFELGIVPLLAMARCGDQIDMSAATARFAKAARVRMGTLLPWDLRGGFRSCPPIGDGYYAPDETFPILAALFDQRDPELAKHLMWAATETGRSFGGHPTPPGILIDPGKEAVQPNLGSEHYEGMGFVMRNGFPRHDETFFLGLAGSFSVGHGHADRGAFIYYAKGAPLMVDFAAMYTPSIGEAWLHPGGLSFNHDETVRPCPGRDQQGCYYTGKVWQDHKVEPFTSLEPGWDPQAKDLDEAMGKVTRFVTLPAADYAEMVRPVRYLNRVPYALPETHNQLVTRGESEDAWAKQPFTWTRRYVLVKDPDPMGHNYVVFRDDLGGNTELVPALNLWCLADNLKVTGQHVNYVGQHGVDVTCFVAEPKAFAHRTHRVSHPCGFGFAPYYEKTFGKKFEEAQLLCQIPQAPGKGGYFVAMIPRKNTELPPIINAVLDHRAVDAGDAIHIVWPDRTDTVVLVNQPKEVAVEGLVLQGTAFVVTRPVGGKLAVTMLAPGRVKQGGKELLSGEGGKMIEVGQ